MNERFFAITSNGTEDMKQYFKQSSGHLFCSSPQNVQNNSLIFDSVHSRGYKTEDGGLHVVSRM